MAINYASKYSKEITNIFRQTSYIDGMICHDYEFEGVKTVNAYTLITQPLVDYQRSGDNRYGETKEMQDTVQEFTMARDRGFSISVDKGNRLEEMGIKDGAQVLRAEIDEQVTPEMDKWAYGQFINYAGKIVAAPATAYTKENVAQAVADGLVRLGNKKVPLEGRTIVMGWTFYNMFQFCDEFVKGASENLAEKTLLKGQQGMFMGAKVVVVPDEYLEHNGVMCNFVIIYKRSAIAPKKIQDYFDKENPKGINGHVYEGRFLYDAFVIGGRSDGIYANVENGSQLAAPTMAAGTTAGTCKITLAAANTIKYTTDGTDPRYSNTATLIASAAATPVLTGNTVVKAVGFADNKFTSDVAEYTVPA